MSATIAEAHMLIYQQMGNRGGASHALPVPILRDAEHLHGPGSNRDSVRLIHMIVVKVHQLTSFVQISYYQPNPPATIPFPVERKYDDPDFAAACLNRAGNCAMGWGLRIIDSQNILGYGVGLYSFFDNYSTSEFPSFPFPLPPRIPKFEETASGC